jgi:hypothetical protein
MTRIINDCRGPVDLRKRATCGESGARAFGSVASAKAPPAAAHFALETVCSQHPPTLSACVRSPARRSNSAPRRRWFKPFQVVKEGVFLVGAGRRRAAVGCSVLRSQATPARRRGVALAAASAAGARGARAAPLTLAIATSPRVPGAVAVGQCRSAAVVDGRELRGGRDARRLRRRRRAATGRRCCAWGAWGAWGGISGAPSARDGSALDASRTSGGWQAPCGGGVVPPRGRVCL